MLLGSVMRLVRVLHSHPSWAIKAAGMQGGT